MSVFSKNLDLIQKYDEEREQREKENAYSFTADQSATYGRNSDHATPNWLMGSS
jgi:hypothetical protein